MGNLLKNIQVPDDIKELKLNELSTLANELRQYIIETVSANPGHLGSSLGVVELTIALHYVFNTPYDKIIWDVGHQAYPHKILTGRKNSFHTNRKLNGVAGFPKMSESPYDAFGVGHSSTSISAALGMAEASALKGETDRHHIAVIGDGSVTGGMAFEAINNAGVSKSNILVILNDNGIAIDPNVGAIHQYMTNISTSKTYNRMKSDMWKILGKLDALGQGAKKLTSQMEYSLKAFLLEDSNIFESMNFRYFGPVNGYNISRMVKLLNDIKDLPGPKVLHVLTTKGKGLPLAEKDPITYHAPGLFNHKTGALEGRTASAQPAPIKYQDVFGHTLLELAEKDEKVVGITPAMPTGSSLTIMMEKIPERVFDVGIAEQHAVTFSAGLAASGMVPFCNIYSTFMQRAFDQVIHDVALQKLPVIFCLDRAGVVGEDGPTHHGSFDLAYFRCIPNMVVAAPMDEWELRNMMYTAHAYKEGPFSIRYPRGKGHKADWRNEPEILPIGKGRQIIQGKEIAIIGVGTVAHDIMQSIEELSAQGIYPSFYDMRFLKPLDEALVQDAFKHHKHIITVEDGSLIGGLASAIAEMKNKYDYLGSLKSLGIPDQFVTHGSPEELHQLCGYAQKDITAAIVQLLQ